MAAIVCDTGDGNDAVATVYFPASGEQVRVCGDCFPMWCVAVLADITGTPAESIVAIINADGGSTEVNTDRVGDFQLDEDNPDLFPKDDQTPNGPTRQTKSLHRTVIEEEPDEQTTDDANAPLAE